MKKVLLTITAAMLLLGTTLMAQAEGEGDNSEATQTEAATDEAATEESDSTNKDADSTKVDSAAAAAAAAKEAEMNKPADTNDGGNVAPPEPKKEEGHALIKKYFIEGGWEFMSVVLLCLVLGLAFAIERLVVLSMKQINLKKFVAGIEGKLAKGDVNGAKQLARNTPGPIASIYYQGLDRAEEGTEIVEKSIVSYGSVQMGLLEKGMVWISLFISLAPMLGFMGTVIGMIIAFDKIEVMGDIEPSAVAGGIKVALLTTVAGLIVAIILQIFYNLIQSIIDSMVNRMEDASITLVDMMVKYGIVKD